MSGLESDVCKIQHLHVTLEGAIREFQSFQATLLVYILHRGKEIKQNCFEIPSFLNCPFLCDIHFFYAALTSM